MHIASFSFTTYIMKGCHGSSGTGIAPPTIACTKQLLHQSHLPIMAMLWNLFMKPPSSEDVEDHFTFQQRHRAEPARRREMTELAHQGSRACAQAVDDWLTQAAIERQETCDGLWTEASPPRNAGQPGLHLVQTQYLTNHARNTSYDRIDGFAHSVRDLRCSDRSLGRPYLSGSTIVATPTLDGNLSLREFPLVNQAAQERTYPFTALAQASDIFYHVRSQASSEVITYHSNQSAVSFYDRNGRPIADSDTDSFVSAADQLPAGRYIVRRTTSGHKLYVRTPSSAPEEEEDWSWCSGKSGLDRKPRSDVPADAEDNDNDSDRESFPIRPENRGKPLRSANNLGHFTRRGLRFVIGQCNASSSTNLTRSGPARLPNGQPSMAPTGMRAQDTNSDSLLDEVIVDRRPSDQSTTCRKGKCRDPWCMHELQTSSPPSPRALFEKLESKIRMKCKSVRQKVQDKIGVKRYSISENF
jgi:hypothetical protein